MGYFMLLKKYLKLYEKGHALDPNLPVRTLSY